MHEFHVWNVKDQTFHILRPILAQMYTIWRWSGPFWCQKVGIFWEGHKTWKNLPLKVWRYSVASNFKWKIVAFSEYPDFTYRTKVDFLNAFYLGTLLCEEVFLVFCSCIFTSFASYHLHYCTYYELKKNRENSSAPAQKRPFRGLKTYLRNIMSFWPYCIL